MIDIGKDLHTANKVILTIISIKGILKDGGHFSYERS